MQHSRPCQVRWGLKVGPSNFFCEEKNKILQMQCCTIECSSFCSSSELIFWAFKCGIACTPANCGCVWVVKWSDCVHNSCLILVHLCQLSKLPFLWGCSTSITPQPTYFSHYLKCQDCVTAVPRDTDGKSLCFQLQTYSLHITVMALLFSSYLSIASFSEFVFFKNVYAAVLVTETKILWNFEIPLKLKTRLVLMKSIFISKY